MTRAEGKALILDYIDGWKAGDVQKILRPLTVDCVVTESHGPTFSGHAEIKQWVDDLHRRGSRVLRWEVNRLVQDEHAAALEWAFECEDLQVRHLIDGASVFEFEREGIARITEYRRTEKPFPGIARH